MFKTIRNAWSIPDLRKKLLFTLLIIVVFRIGSVIPVPFIDTAALQEAMQGANSVGAEANNMIAYLNTLSGGAFSNATIFAMGITPYINSSIIIQLLCVAIPALERLSKEGEAGRKKIGTITRYVTVGLGLIQGTAYFFYLHNSGITQYREGFSMVFAAYVCEMFRSSILALGKGQVEAGIALGFTPMQTFFYIIAPQAIRNVMPVYKGEAVSLFKSTSIVGYIAIVDLTKASDLVRSRTFDAFFPLIVIAIIYFVLAWLLGKFLDRLVKVKKHKTA